MPTLHTLLVSIDNYPNPRHALNGCVNDGMHFHQYLESYCEKMGFTFRPLVLNDSEATRQAVIAGFDHFKAAESEDCCLFYYSGHGSRSAAPEAFWGIEHDHSLESIVCWDSREPGGHDLMDNEQEIIKELFLLTNKPVLYIANVAESQLATQDKEPLVLKVKAIAAKEKAEVVVLAAALEAEIQQLPEEDRPSFLKDSGLDEPGLNKVVRAGYRMLGLQTYFTVGEKECRAWTIHKGYTAPQAAGVIHTDFEKGFIKAEVMSCKDLLELGSEAAVKEKGLLRIEGKEYVVQDGDCMHFRFNVTT